MSWIRIPMHQGEIDVSLVDEIVPRVYEGDLSTVPRLTSYRLDEDRAELVFAKNAEDDLLESRVREVAAKVSNMNPIGEVGFTYSVSEDVTTRQGVLDSIEIVDVSVSSSVNFGDPSSISRLAGMGHTHPIPVPFSATDIHGIMTYPDIPHMVIIGNNRGYLYLPHKGMSMFELVPSKSNS